MALTSIFDLVGNHHENRGTNWTTIWEACCSTIYRVVDEEGNNVADGKIRHFQGRYWLYVDDTDGYQVMQEEDAEHLILTAD